MTTSKVADVEHVDLRDDPPTSPANASTPAHGVNLEEYRMTVPWWKRVWQHSLTQMMLLSVQSFCGPAMSDAITGRNYTI